MYIKKYYKPSIEIPKNLAKELACSSISDNIRGCPTLVNGISLKSFIFKYISLLGVKPSFIPVSYTHLTLPTIYSV